VHPAVVPHHVEVRAGSDRPAQSLVHAEVVGVVVVLRIAREDQVGVKRR
jgi:hypothetical protein